MADKTTWVVCKRYGTAGLEPLYKCNVGGACFSGSGDSACGSIGSAEIELNINSDGDQLYIVACRAKWICKE